MAERQTLLGKMPDKSPSAKSAMNDRYLTGLGLLLTVVVVSKTDHCNAMRGS